MVFRHYYGWGVFDEIEEIFNLLLSKGPARGYFPEPTKSILVVKPAMVEQVKACFNHLWFQVTTGTIYLGVFVEIPADKLSHIQANVGEWATSITTYSV